MSNEQTVEQFWATAPAGAVVVPQELKEGSEVIYTGNLDIQGLWAAPVEVLRAYAAKQMILDSQKDVKAAIKGRFDKDGKVTTAPRPEAEIQEFFDANLGKTPRMVGVTPGSTGTKAQVDPIAAMAASLAGLSKKERLAKLEAMGLLSD